MRFNFITLFPSKILSYFQEGLHAKAIQKGILELNVLNLRDFANNKHGKVDDTVYGGGAGMLLKVEPFDLALKSLGEKKGFVVLTSPSGYPFSQKIGKALSKKETITFLSGYYEGVDHRVTEFLVDVELSLGNYVLSSGDLASLCISDAVLRLVPGFLGDYEHSLEEESHNEEGILEYPQYTKPAEYNGWKVPEVLLTGHHAEIQKWRNQNRKKPVLKGIEL
ncbi:MAG: tRNA (guanosine(37)-N1)-methyltransferase TrmD [Leptospiraceae bacterium]|nr:tRNA (guanosine(37)-N1)-methyltransferase TrmD [Leptospiraceae bacterium]